MAYLASDVYGTTSSLQPTPGAAPSHAGQPEPMAVTQAPIGKFSADNPTLLLVGLLALAIVLIHFSVGFDFGFKVGAKR